MNKIGILTFHNAHNYGAMLQAYALQKKCEKYGDCEIINYNNKKISNQYKVIRTVGKNPVKITKRILSDLKNYKLKRIRFDKFNDFMNSYLKLSEEKYLSEKNIKNEELKYDIIITGSDQVWNPQIVGELSDIYTLNFGQNEIKRISYAASVGDTKVIINDKESFKNKLAKLDFISVREEDAQNELSKIISKNINVVLDPTLLMSKEEWNSELTEISNYAEKYIIAYVVEPDEEYIKIVNHLSEKTGLRVVHFGLKNPGYKNVWKSAYTEGPFEFINLIKNAEYVVATSFHATVFSIIFNKRFFIIPHRKTGARVTNLLKRLEIDRRTFSNYDEFKNIDYNFETDWKQVEKILKKEQEKSIKWLKDAIGGVKNNIE